MLIQDILPEATELVCQTKAFLAFVWRISLVAWETAAEAGRKI